MKSSASLRQQPFSRKSTVTCSPSSEEFHSQISIRLDDDVSSSASGRRFIRRQRIDNTQSRSRHSGDGDTSFQFVTVKKLQELRENVNGFSPDIKRQISNQAECPETDKKCREKLQPIPEVLNSPTATSASPSKSFQNVPTSRASAQTYNSTVLTNKSVQQIISQISIQTSNLGSPKGTEKKVIDYRTRPGTPHKEEHSSSIGSNGKLQNYIQRKNQRAANQNTALRTFSTGPQQTQERKVRMLQARIAELQKLLENADLQHEKCDELQVKLKRQVAMSQKLKQQSDRKQLQIDLLRQQLNRAIMSVNRNTGNKKAENFQPLKKTTSLTSQKIRQSNQYKEIETQIGNLRTQNYELCMKIQQLEKQLNQAKKTIKTQSEQLAVKQRNCINKLRAEMEEQKSQRENLLQEELNHIGSQLQQILEKGGEFDRELMEELQREVLKIKKQLSYYHVAIHCTLRQLQEVRLQSSMKVPLIEHNELKDKFKRMAIKVRQLTMLKGRNPRNDDLFELTPQK